MPQTHCPRKGSMQYWPRKRASRIYARIRYWPKSSKPILQGFIGYKAGMSHMIISDNRQHSKQKNQELFMPITIIECPPIRIIGAKFYKKTPYGFDAVSQIFAQKLDKDLARKISLPKKEAKKFEDMKEFDDIRAIVAAQPRLTGIGKKKPEIIEVGIGGDKEQKISFIKENLGKELHIKDVFTEGQQLDTHSVTKGKGLQGPVKRFGVALRSHKSEKTKRGPGSLGAWKAQQHIMYRVAHAGQMGYHQRVEFNKWLIKIGDKPQEINPAGGFKHYGIVKNAYIIIKGSIGGAKNRTIILTNPLKPNKKIPKSPPTINYTKQ